jgi:molybdopterin synthase catalytic subunit
MRVEIVAFAALREALGTPRLQIELAEGATSETLRHALAERYPRYALLLESCRLAQGVEFLKEDAILVPGMEVVLIPPVSGGNGPPEILLTRETLRSDPLREAALDRESGAVVVFEGVVRATSEGRAVRHLEYEAYEPMALEQMRRIVAETRAGWPLGGVYLHHRLGHLEIGELSVVAVASSPHRAEAFAACRHLIERLKADVPIRKKEMYEDGGEWVGAPGEC